MFGKRKKNRFIIVEVLPEEYILVDTRIKRVLDWNNFVSYKALEFKWNYPGVYWYPYGKTSDLDGMKKALALVEFSHSGIV